MTGTLVIKVNDPSGVADARRRTLALASRLAFAEAPAGNVAISVTEVATNLVKHARHGTLLVQAVTENGRRGLDLVGIDRGPGIASVATALRNGYSTAGSAGTGLGALSRLADSFDLHSMPGGGTVIAARFWAGPRRGSTSRARMEIAGFSVAVAGEPDSGDAWVHEDQPRGARILVADGLGHGAGAAQASRRAVELFEGGPGLAPVAVLDRLHAGLRDTRGAAAAVAEVDLDRGVLCWAGVGNVAGTIVAGAGARSMVSHNGTLGHETRRTAGFEYAFPAGALLVLHSDGISSRWSLDAYPGLAARHPAVVAAVLYRDFGRERDDATVVVARAARPEAAA